MGSEMCIRDRAFPLPDLRGHTGGARVESTLVAHSCYRLKECCTTRRRCGSSRCYPEDLVHHTYRAGTHCNTYIYVWVVKPGRPGVRCLSLHSRRASQGMVADLAVLCRREHLTQNYGSPHDGKACRTRLKRGIGKTRESLS